MKWLRILLTKSRGFVFESRHFLISEKYLVVNFLNKFGPACYASCGGKTSNHSYSILQSVHKKPYFNRLVIYAWVLEIFINIHKAVDVEVWNLVYSPVQWVVVGEKIFDIQANLKIIHFK